MGKRTRIVLYALSLVTMLAMVTLIIFSHGRQSGEPAKDALSETDIRNRFRYRKRKNQKRRKQQTGRTGSKTTQNRKKWT